MAADVASALYSWSTSEGSNAPSGTTSVSTNLDDNLRMIQKVVRGWLATKGSDIASAGTTDLGAVEGLAHDITGTTTITGFGTVVAGILKVLKFEGALTLTHNATSLIIPGGANITTADGDVALVISEGSGNWRVLSYFKAASLYITATSTDTLTNKTLTSPTVTTPTLNGALAGTSIATQAEQETGSVTDKIVTPGRQHFHRSGAKGWAMFATDGTVNLGYNVASVTDNGAGSWTVSWSTDFSSGAYAVVASVVTDASISDVVASVDSASFAAGTTAIFGINTTDGNVSDPTNNICVIAFGDHA
jgi:hypothetical protein